MYTKLFGSMIHSTIWRESKDVRLLWVTMLLMVDREGFVWASVPGLADAARLTIAECEVALERLQAPDPYSRRREAEGRHIEQIDGGWRIVNYAHYRDLKDAENRREQVRVAVTRLRKRERNPENFGSLPDSSLTIDSDVIIGNHGNPVKSQVIGVIPSEVEVTTATTNNKIKSNNGRAAKKRGARAVEEPPIFAIAWAAYPKRAGSNPRANALKQWRARVREGVAESDMLAGVERYRAFCDATGKTGTETVMQAQRFFGENQEFADEWTPPVKAFDPNDWEALRLAEEARDAESKIWIEERLRASGLRPPPGWEG